MRIELTWAILMTRLWDLLRNSTIHFHMYLYIWVRPLIPWVASQAVRCSGIPKVARSRVLWFASRIALCNTWSPGAQSEINRRGNVENDWNSSVVRRSPSKAIIRFLIISDHFQCRKCRFPDVGPGRKCQGFCALKASEFQLKHALHNSLSMYFN